MAGERQERSEGRKTDQDQRQRVAVGIVEHPRDHKTCECEQPGAGDQEQVPDFAPSRPQTWGNTPVENLEAGPGNPKPEDSWQVQRRAAARKADNPRGGASEIVIESETGVLFENQTADALVEGIARLEGSRLDPTTLRTSALRFSRRRFIQEFARFLEAIFAAKPSPAVAAWNPAEAVQAAVTERP
ncbi:MAG: hypothetical protein LAO07_13975 [Acidobacteriia bacterium]|nr:hypothetical protein [Terriglobia bacterium]